MHPLDGLSDLQKLAVLSDLPFFAQVQVPPPIEVEHPPHAEPPRIESGGTTKEAPKRKPGRPRKQ